MDSGGLAKEVVLQAHDLAANCSKDVLGGRGREAVYLGPVKAHDTLF